MDDATTTPPRRNRRRFLIGGAVVAAAALIGGVFMLAGGDGDTTEHSDEAAQTVTYSAGDVAACVGYARVDDRIREDTAAIQDENERMPLFVYGTLLERDADRLRDNMIAATSAEIIAARDASIAGFDSAVATVADFAKTEGTTLDIVADLTSVYHASKTLAALCDEANASTTHLPLIEP